MAALVKNKFTRTGYTSDNGEVYKIRISNTDRALQTTNDTGPTVTALGSATQNNRRKSGMHCRGLRLERVTGTSPNVVSFSTFFPVLLPADFTGYKDGATLTIGGVAWTIVKHIAESYR